MPAKSENQQQAAGAALSAKEGKTPVEKLFGAAKSMYNSMSATQLRHLAETSTKGLPAKVKEKKAGVDEAYWQGFAAKCAEYGVDPEALVKIATFFNPSYMTGATGIPGVAPRLTAEELARQAKMFSMLNQAQGAYGRVAAMPLGSTAQRRAIESLKAAIMSLKGMRL